MFRGQGDGDEPHCSGYMSGGAINPNEKYREQRGRRRPYEDDNLLITINQSISHQRSLQNRQIRGRRRPHEDDNLLTTMNQSISHQRSLQNRQIRPIGYEQLETMEKTMTPSDLVVTLAGERSGLEQLLRKDINYGMTQMLLKVFAKMSESHGATKSLVRLLQMIHTYAFHAKIMDFILNGLLLETNLDKRRHASCHLNNVCKLLRMFLTVIPSTSRKMVSITMKILDSAINRLGDLDQEVARNYKQIEIMLKSIGEQEKPKKLKKSSFQINDNDLHAKAPPSNFREIPVFPQLEDIHGTAEPFLRTNLVDKAYNDTNHYLDVQFRLLREDFIRPLREGVTEIMHRDDYGKRKKIVFDNVKVYNEVRVEYTKPSRRGILHRIRFSIEGLQNVKWRKTKRLQQENLLCFSSDCFEENVYFAIIADRNPADLQKGILTVRFVEDEEADNDNPSDEESNSEELDIAAGHSCPHAARRQAKTRIDMWKRYTMVESVAYFEAYRHVLASLKEIDQIPLERYIVRCLPDIKTPEYLRSSAAETVCYDFSSIADGEVFAKSVPMLDPASWPSEMKLGLDHTQTEALKLALTNELAIIQGPPGTGKTYIGLIIMKILLANKNAWQHTRHEFGFGQKCPILVVCYTNHALDQFLEGIIEFLGKDPNIVRVGGRSDNEEIKKYSLTQIRRTNGDQYFRNAIRQLNECMRPFEKTLSEESDAMEASFHRIRHFQELQTAIPVYLRNQFLTNQYQHRLPGNHDVMLEWLMLNDNVEKTRWHQWNITRGQIEKNGNRKKKEGWQQTKRYKEMSREEIISRELEKTTMMQPEEEERIPNIYDLSQENRWRLYRTWTHRWRKEFHCVSDKDIKKYNGMSRSWDKLRNEQDSKILQSADVIAVTTTGAAKYRKLIYNLNCKIVVIEEAAEVLEAHIITSMPKTTSHLILIGDHQQLKPKTTVYQLARKYNLDTSLFERLISKIPHVTLSRQHRMRPSIADLLRPRIYKNLSDDESVQDREAIVGVRKPLFFVTHEVPEQNEGDGRSKKNRFEASFLVALCNYLLKQGYKPSQITILAMYTGQVSAFGGELCEGVRVTAVDNFQGEENDIILLSLVRSNDDEKIGFLSIENRICVALSRAKSALYCIGNMKLLAAKSSMWRSIVDHLVEKESIGNSLQLQCKHHPDKLAMVKCAQDFAKVPEGGCGQFCHARLECGHTCPRPCHPEDHSKYKCQKVCEKILCELGHKCKKKCYEDCGPCATLVQKVIPKCGHWQQLACSAFPHTAKCKERVTVKLQCGHDAVVSCYLSENPPLNMCKEKCHAILDCEHRCMGSCYECFQGRLHLPCLKKCNRTLVCGHACKSSCDYCLPCLEKCETRCQHNTCERRCGEPCIMCHKKCEWSCEHYTCSMLCSEPCDRPSCNEPCKKLLKKCKHRCIGLCGEPCPTLCQKCDKDVVTESFFGDEDKPDAKFVQLEECGHVFTYENLDRWMNQKEDDGAIKMKECPKCKTPIWKSRRYGKIINDLLNSMNEVKKKTWGKRSEAKRVRYYLYDEISHEIKNSKLYVNYRKEKEQIFEELTKVTMMSHKLILIEEKYRRIQRLEKLKKALHESKEVLAMADVEEEEEEENRKIIKDFEQNLDTCLKWVMLDRQLSTEQEKVAFHRETEKLIESLKFLCVKSNYYDVDSDDDYDWAPENKLRKILIEGFEPFDEEKQSLTQEYFETILDLDPSLSSDLGIFDEERTMIGTAMGFAKKGHWCKCPKGHVYCIGDCGGAVVTSNCPECNAEIGGASHSLRADNSVATEMDGATQSAFDSHDLRIPDELLEDHRRQGFQ